VSNEVLFMDESCGEDSLDLDSTILVISHDNSKENDRRDSRDDINSCDGFPYERSSEHSYVNFNENFEFGDDSMIINYPFFPNSIDYETNKQFQSQKHGLSQDSYSYNIMIDYGIFHPIYDICFFDSDTNES
jgi:hypothetical protein